MKNTSIRWRRLPGALWWHLISTPEGNFLGMAALIVLAFGLACVGFARNAREAKRYEAAALSITPITSYSDGASGLTFSGDAYDVTCTVSGDTVTLYAAMHDGTSWRVYDATSCTLAVGSGRTCRFPAEKQTGQTWNAYKTGSGSVASCTAKQAFGPLAKRAPASGGGGGSELVRPAVGALDILVYAGGSLTNEGAAGALTLTASGGAVSYGGIGPYRAGIWSPGAGGGLASANTTKGEETGALTLWAWMMAPETSGSPYVIPVVGKEYVGGWSPPWVDLYLRLHGDLSCGVGVYLGGGVYSSYTSAAGALSAGTMHLLALVYDPAVGADFYIDGVLDGSDHVNKGAISYSAGPWIVMAEAAPDTPHSLAWVAEWRLHRGALTAGEILAIYRSWVPA